MELSIHQEALIHLLKKFNLEREAILLISMMLSKSTRSIEAFIYISNHEGLTKEEEFLDLALFLAKRLPPEEQTGVVMNERFSL